MPMIDAYIPEGALWPDTEKRLLLELTDILIELEGFQPDNALARAATWIFLHRPEVFVAGSAPLMPRYRFVVSVPEGQYDDERRSGVVREVTAAVARAEKSTFEAVSSRVWVFPIEVPDGRWGGHGEVRHLPDIMASLVSESERHAAVELLRSRRQAAAEEILQAAPQNGNPR